MIDFFAPRNTRSLIKLFKIQAGFRVCSMFCDSALSFLAGFPYGVFPPACILPFLRFC